MCRTQFDDVTKALRLPMFAGDSIIVVGDASEQNVRCRSLKQYQAHSTHFPMYDSLNSTLS
jgi:hypothetical protein